jgi:hypothetical protein
MTHYILDGHTPKPVADVTEWAWWFETADRKVALDEMGDVCVSTVFLGIDHRLVGDGPPLLFETMVFRNGHGDEQERYATWEEAERGHAEMVARVMAERSGSERLA